MSNKVTIPEFLSFLRVYTIDAKSCIHRPERSKAADRRMSRAVRKMCKALGLKDAESLTDSDVSKAIWGG